jgi:small subunit ribosomal protein S16
MSVKIRLRRIGRKKQPSYRVVVTETAAPRDGAYLDTVGFYNPRRQPAELRMDLDRVDAWLGRGAGMSDTVASLIRKARKGGDRKVELKPLKGEPPAERPVIEAPAPPRARARAGSRGRGPAAAPAEASPAQASTAVEPEAPADSPQAIAEAVSEPRPDRGETGPQGTPEAAETAE